MDNDDLRKKLAEHGISQREFARRLGVHWATVQKWCAATRKVPGYVAAYFRALEGGEGQA